MSDSGRANQLAQTALPLAVVLCAPDDHRGALAHGLRGLIECVWCSSIDEAEHAIVEQRPVVFATRTRDTDGRSVRALVGRARFAFPRMPILIVPAAIVNRSYTPLRPFHWVGVSEVIAEDDAARTRISAHVSAAQQRVRRVEIGATLAALVPGPAQDVVRRAIEDADMPRSVRELAAAIGVPRKSMDRRLSKAIPVTARQLIGWGRLVAVAMRLETPTATVDAVAHELAFSSPSALRNLLQRYAGLTPTELRRIGGAPYLVERLMVALQGTPQ